MAKTIACRLSHFTPQEENEGGVESPTSDQIAMDRDVDK